MVLRTLKIGKNDQKLSFLDHFAFSNTFFGLKMKHYHPKFFSVENMHEVAHLQNIRWFFKIAPIHLQA